MSGIDSEIGIGAYTTKHPGVGGVIRRTPGDFIVREVLTKGAQGMMRAGGRYAVYVLKKSGIDTPHAISDIRRRTGLKLKALGLKDASAVTEQYVCSTSGAGPDGFRTSRYSLERAGSAPRPLSKGDMSSNRFVIRIDGCSGLEEFTEYDRILNYYGYQRFGSRRPVTHLVGRALVRGDIRGAVDTLVGGDDYAKLLAGAPRWMDIERAVLRKMVEGAGAPAALRAAPVRMRRFYVQAYQSYVFNRSIAAAHSAGEDLFAPRDGDVCFGPGGDLGRYGGGGGQRLAVPTVGYGYYTRTRFDPYISPVLEEEGVRPGDFAIRGMDEASSEGGFRQAAIQCTDCTARGDIAEFTLSRGSFATMVLREVVKPADPLAAGF